MPATQLLHAEHLRHVLCASVHSCRSGCSLHTCVQGGEVQVTDEQKVNELVPAIQNWMEAAEIDRENDEPCTDEEEVDEEPAPKRARTRTEEQPREPAQLALALRQEYTQSALKKHGRGALKGTDKSRVDLLVAALERVWLKGFKLWLVQVRLCAQGLLCSCFCLHSFCSRRHHVCTRAVRL